MPQPLNPTETTPKPSVSLALDDLRRRLAKRTLMDGPADEAELAAVPIIDTRPYWEADGFVPLQADWRAVLANFGFLTRLVMQGRFGEARRQARRIATTRRDHESGATYQLAAPCDWPRNRPLISVIVPCYNYGDYLDTAVQSVLNQTFQDFELIIVDDGSPQPETQAKIASYVERAKTHPQLRVLIQQNTGLPGARDGGIAIARGRYILCLDADDTIEESALEKQVAVLELHAEPGAASPAARNTNAKVTRNNGSPFVLNRMAWLNLNIQTTMYRRTDWEAVGGHGRYMRLGYEDWEFWCRLALRGVKAHHVQEELYLYNVRPGTMLSNSEKKDHLLRSSINRANPKLNDADYTTGIAAGYRTTLRRDPFRNMRQNFRVPDGTRSVIFFMRALNDRGGAQRIMLQTARHMQAQGWRVIFVGAYTPAEEMSVNNKTFTSLTREVYNLPTMLPGVGWQDFFEYLIETRNVQTVFGNTTPQLYNWAPALKAKFPHLKIVDGLYVPDAGVMKPDESGITYSRANMDFIDSYVIESEAGRRAMLMAGVPDSRIAVVPNGLHLGVFHPGKRSIDFRRPFLELGQSAGGKPTILVGFCGRLSEQKNVEMLFQMIVRTSDLPNIQWLVAGTGPQESTITNLAPETGNLHYLGQVNNTAALLANLDLLFLPSLVEGRPNAMLEALASGTPVLGSTAGAIAETLVEGEIGWAIPAARVDLFEARLRALAADPAQLEPMRAKCRAFAEANLDQARMLELYQRLLEDKA